MSFDSPGDTDDARLERTVHRIEALIQNDPGARGLAFWAEQGDLLPAARSLCTGTRIAITTGFYIPAGGAIETDGPPGAILLARALTALGKDVQLIVDEHARHIISAGSECIPGPAPTITTLPAGDSPELQRLAQENFSHIVAIERPGRSANGTYRTMRGEDISPYVAALDELFTAPDRTYTTIAVGDGGNELGLSKVAARVDRFLPTERRISCRTPADHVVFAGVSNWGAYGLCTLLAELTGEPVAPDPTLVEAILRAIVAAGAVDGVLLDRVVSVDGLPLEEETGIAARLREIPGSEPTGGILGDSAFLWSWPGGISRETSARVLAAYRLFRDDQALRDAGMVDVVPAYCALAVHLDPGGADRERLRERAETLLKEAVGDDSPQEVATWTLPVRYNGEDLTRVAEHAGLTPREVVDLHVAPVYTVAMIGFRPHFPYLIGMDERIATPRLDSPRTHVPAGSVGIAGNQTGVYPVDSPGGWNLIGTTDPALLKPVRPGDTIDFEEV